MQTQTNWEKVPGTPGFYRRKSGDGYVYRFRAPGETSWTRVPGNPKEQEAKQWRNRYIGEDVAVRVKPSSTKFIDVAEAALTALERNRRAAGTMELHRLHLRLYLKGLHNLPIQEIDRHVLIAKVVRPMESGELSKSGKPLSGSTIHNAVMTASVVFEFAIDCRPRLTSDNPVRRVKGGEARPGRKSSKKRVVLNETQLVALLAAARTPAHRLVYATLALTGLRISECLRLTWGMIDFQNRLIWPDGTKTEASKGSVQLSKRLASMLATHKLACVASDEDWVFVSQAGTPFSVRNIQHRFDEAVVRVQKIDPSFPTLTPHHLRHTFASQLLMATGGDIALASSQTRHASPATFLAVYAHEVSQAKDDRRAADAIDATLGAAL